jgi:hypothetical protein
MGTRCLEMVTFLAQGTGAKSPRKRRGIFGAASPLPKEMRCSGAPKGRWRRPTASFAARTAEARRGRKHPSCRSPLNVAIHSGGFSTRLAQITHLRVFEKRDRLSFVALVSDPKRETGSALGTVRRVTVNVSLAHQPASAAALKVQLRGCLGRSDSIGRESFLPGLPCGGHLFQEKGPVAVWLAVRTWGAGDDKSPLAGATFPSTDSQPLDDLGQQKSVSSTAKAADFDEGLKPPVGRGLFHGNGIPKLW